MGRAEEEVRLSAEQQLPALLDRLGLRRRVERVNRAAEGGEGRGGYVVVAMPLLCEIMRRGRTRA